MNLYAEQVTLLKIKELRMVQRTNNSAYAAHNPLYLKAPTGLLIKGFQTKPDGFISFDAGFLEQSIKTKYGINKPPTRQSSLHWPRPWPEALPEACR
jgi:hypothetical protein